MELALSQHGFPQLCHFSSEDSAELCFSWNHWKLIAPSMHLQILWCWAQFWSQRMDWFKGEPTRCSGIFMEYFRLKLWTQLIILIQDLSEEHDSHFRCGGVGERWALKLTPDEFTQRLLSVFFSPNVYSWVERRKMSPGVSNDSLLEDEAGCERSSLVDVESKVLHWGNHQDETSRCWTHPLQNPLVN